MTNAQKAAEEIATKVHSCMVFLCDMCGPNRPMPCRFGKAVSNQAYPDKEAIKSDFAAIIEKHCGDAEKVLQAAAKWAVCGDGGWCPGSICSKCPDPDFEPCPGACTEDEKTKCWIEFWRKGGIND